VKHTTIRSAVLTAACCAAIGACHDATPTDALSLIGTPQASLVTNITVSDLGFEVTLVPFFGGLGINANGDVAAALLDAQFRSRAVLRAADGNLIDLGTLGGSQAAANDVNDLGQVVGWSYTSDNPVSHAFRWTVGTGMQDLGTLPGGHFSYASAINNLGQVVGFSDGPGNDHAFLWTAERGMQDLGTLGGPFSEALDINDLGQVVGSSTLSNSTTRAFLWTPSTGMHDLGGLVSAGYSEALGLNNLGHVVGRAGTQTADHAFLWRPESGMVDLGPSSGCSSDADAFAINDFDQVVGRLTIVSKVLAACEAFVWTAEGGMVDLGGLGGSFPEARTINNVGQVVGASDNPTNTQFRATLWTVQFTPPTPVEQILRVETELQNAVSVGALSDGQADGLRAKLEAATQQFNKDNLGSAINLIQAFIRQVQSYTNAGIVSAPAGQSLIDAAQSAINELMS